MNALVRQNQAEAKNSAILYVATITVAMVGAAVNFSYFFL
ncbi:UNVERIFIED_CONTAM: hypothetical protein C7454_12239 [Acidovorax defluvii]